MKSLWTHLNAEPTVDEILDDPIVRLLMRGDRTGQGEVRSLIERLRAALGVEEALGPEAAPAPGPVAAETDSKAA